MISSNIGNFDYTKLNIFRAFGDSEGEKDDIDKGKFIITKSIEQFLTMNYTYVISPKGSGKSALFRALVENILPTNIFDSSKYLIVDIDTAFLFQDTYLNLDKYKSNDPYYNYIISWSSYLLNRIIKKINNFRDQIIGSQQFLNEIRKYEYLKEDFELYNVIDRIQELQLPVSIIIGGLPIEIAPKLKFGEMPRKKIKLNDIFDLINDLLHKNGKSLLILIDRIDNFVKREEHDVQEKYVQGLVSTIEEMIGYKYIKPILFIRTDLYNTFNISAEYDKIQQRSLELKWKKDEALRFILTRFLAIKYIRERYFSYLIDLMINEYRSVNKNKVSFSKFLLQVLGFSKKTQYRLLVFKKHEQYNPTLNLSYRISSSFIKLFMPADIEHKNIDRSFSTSKFCDWLFSHFTDKNDVVNPRILINFYNKLFECQFYIYSNDQNKLIENDKYCKAQNYENGYFCLNLFMSEAIQECYEYIQNHELIKIYNLIHNKKERKIFLEINQLSYSTGNFDLNSIKTIDYKMHKNDYAKFIKYLNILGFLKHSSDNQEILNIPILFMKKINFDNINIDTSEYINLDESE